MLNQSAVIRMSLIFSCLLTMLLSSVSHAETAVAGNRTTLDDGGVSFVVPEGFQTLTKEVMAAKWLSNRAPRFAVGNKDASTTIAYDIKPNAVTESQLPDLLKTFEQLFPRIIPGLKWKRKEVKKIGDRHWVYVEMTSHAVDTDIYNIVLATPYKGKLLMFNFNSTKEEFPKLENALRESIESIVVKEE